MVRSAARRYSAPALEKGLDAVELLSAAREPMTLSAVAAALDRSRSEMFRVLRVLEARGYIERTRQGDRYRLSNKLFLTGLRRPPVAGLLDVAYPEMRALAAEIRQSCHVSVLSGERMVTVARVEGPGEVSFLLRIGFGVPVALSASGRVVLAFMPGDARAAALADLRRAGAELPRGLAARLALIRRRGYERAPSPMFDGVTDISFPLHDADGAVSACLAAPVLHRRGARDPAGALLPAVRLAAERISARLAAARGQA